MAGPPAMQMAFGQLSSLAPPTRFVPGTGWPSVPPTPTLAPAAGVAIIVYRRMGDPESLAGGVTTTFTTPPAAGVVLKMLGAPGHLGRRG